VKVKICGITTLADAFLAAEAGADYIGVVVEIKFSPRCLSVEQAKVIAKDRLIGSDSFFNWDACQIKRAVKELHPKAIQLQGQESLLS